MLDNNTMVGGQTEDIELESTSFIIDDTEQESYRGPSILISDNEDFSDITQLLHNDEDEEIVWRNTDKYDKYVHICNKKIKQRSIISGFVISGVLMVLCVLLMVFHQMLASETVAQSESDQGLDRLDIVMDADK